MRVSQAGYARHRGCSRRAVQKAIRDGRIKVGRDGLIDVEAADKSWAARTDAAMPKGTRSRRAPAKKGNGRASGADEQGNGSDDGGIGDAFMRSRVVRETFNARLAELDYRRKAGELVEAKAVEKAAFEQNRRARDLVLAIPDRCGPMVLGLTNLADVVRVIAEECRRVCVELSRPPEVRS